MCSRCVWWGIFVVLVCRSMLGGGGGGGGGENIQSSMRWTVYVLISWIG